MDIKELYSLKWHCDTELIENRYICGYCNTHTSSTRGLPLMERSYDEQSYNNGVYICTHCEMPTFLFENEQAPNSKFGNTVNGVSKELSALYNEARDAYSVEAYTAVLLICRKLLMHIAIELGANEGLKFIEYVNYLKDEHYITAKSEKWVDSIRKYGNRSTHEIDLAEKTEAEMIIRFSEMLMKTNFEYPTIMDDIEAK